MSERPRIAVFGAAGQLGSALVRRARRRAVPLEAIARAQADITDAAAVSAALASARADVIVNAAAYAAVDKAESEHERAFAINRDGAANVATAASIAGAGLIHVSTDYVFDGGKPSPYAESDPVAPLGVYGASKADGEQAVLHAMPNDAIIVRTAWVYGLDGANFVKTMLRLGAEREVVRVVDDQRGSPTFADDLADAILSLACALEPARSRIYHATGQGSATWFDFAREIFAETARRGARTPRLEAITTAEYPTPAKRPVNSVLDCGKLERDYGIKLPDWRDGLHRMLKVHLESVR